MFEMVYYKFYYTFTYVAVQYIICVYNTNLDDFGKVDQSKYV